MKKQITVWDCDGYTLIATNYSYILAFTEEPEVIQEQFVLKGGTIAPNDVIIEVSGKRTSCGFTSYKGDGIKYIGTFIDVQKAHKYLLFVNAANPQPKSNPSHGWNFMYYAWVDFEDGDLFFCNTAGSGRILQTNKVVKTLNN